MEEQQTIVQIRAKSFVLEPPKRKASAYLLINALRVESQKISALIAAFGLCSPKFCRMLGVSFEDCDYSIPKFGVRLLDEALEKGIELPELTEAGSKALEIIMSGFVTEKDVKAEEDFLEATKGV